MSVPTPAKHDARSHVIHVDGLETRYWEAGEGLPLVLLHSGEFGASAELSWEYNFAALAEKYHVYAPDFVGFGATAKVHDFNDFVVFKIQHIANFCRQLGLANVPFVGNSMGANFLIRDVANAQPLIPASSFVAISGGGAVPANEARAALTDYDCTVPSMKRVLWALFHDKVWYEDEAYIERRFESSIIPGAWECSAAARLHAPNIVRESAYERATRNQMSYDAVKTPMLLIAGAEDKLKPRGFAHELAEQIPSATAIEMPDVGHCAHIETPDAFHKVLFDFLDSH
ncbi:alpha/beta fold hydrolase [Sphingomonas montanisoli]|uniref:Alpha/beta hydrolase n=1 Tax=Sphingomonas montanisoli TaxID=2606412 RepID=A0A5D9C763_9SPHN|nr:alpha/beta hydrolase [Sphingomonas montanisoli]TZG27688.1 alpha/beta hydrolase [Sphingomonas montanisoli]